MAVAKTFRTLYVQEWLQLLKSVILAVSARASSFRYPYQAILRSELPHLADTMRACGKDTFVVKT
jgi:hypothetical protein